MERREFIVRVNKDEGGATPYDYAIQAALEEALREQGWTGEIVASAIERVTVVR